METEEPSGLYLKEGCLAHCHGVKMPRGNVLTPHCQWPTRNWVRYSNMPKTFRSQTTTAITTTALRMPLICPCIGIRFTSHSNTPTTPNVITTVTRDIWPSPIDVLEDR